MAEPRFVIQQHDATRLHWDLRLEHEGVLLSWALPRGVPWNPKENRLAVHTEDHPLEFLDLEVDPPPGPDHGYGTGRLTDWDRGTFEAHKIEEHKVVVTLSGQRVSGKYSLFSMRKSRDWLIHRMDPPTDTARAPAPIGVPPMTAIAGALPEDDSWSYEPRHRGLRAMVTDDTGRLVITDAAGENVSMQFPEIRRIGRAIGHLEVILDGVIVCPDLGRRLRITSDGGARNAAKTAPATFVAFDLVWVEGRPITDQPWQLRRRRLADLRLDGPAWRTSPVLAADDAFAAELDLVAKRRDSPYLVGKVSDAWIDPRL